MFIEHLKLPVQLVEFRASTDLSLNRFFGDRKFAGRIRAVGRRHRRIQAVLSAKTRRAPPERLAIRPIALLSLFLKRPAAYCATRNVTLNRAPQETHTKTPHRQTFTFSTPPNVSDPKRKIRTHRPQKPGLVPRRHYRKPLIS